GTTMGGIPPPPPLPPVALPVPALAPGAFGAGPLLEPANEPVGPSASPPNAAALSSVLQRKHKSPSSATNPAPSVVFLVIIGPPGGKARSRSACAARWC